MTHDPRLADALDDEPLSDGERRRLGTVLASVDTQTLLHALVGLCRMSEDGKLIIAELIDRLPPEGRPHDRARR